MNKGDGIGGDGKGVRSSQLRRKIVGDKILNNFSGGKLLVTNYIST
jgi:hypothetical protein